MTQPLPIVGYINPLVADALRDPTSGINTTQLRAEPNGCVSEPLVFRSDALAKLAEKDAEITRLRQALDFIVKSSKRVNAKGASAGPQWITFGASIIHAEYALKGPEA